jgi:hypothetical protein
LIILQPAKPLSARLIDPLPRTMLWAWERPVDLRAAPPDVGVAFLAQTITIDATHVAIASRRWPLKVRPTAKLSAVTRIEMLVTRALTDAEYTRIAAAIVAVAALPQVVATQIDFDATESQRGLYRRVIEVVRSRLHSDMPLSITALASWCADDRWLGGLPIDEAVPMLFDMGPLNEPYAAIARRPDIAQPMCRDAVGISLGERIQMAAKDRRVYVFNPRQWSTDSIEAAREWAQR